MSETPEQSTAPVSDTPTEPVFSDPAPTQDPASPAGDSAEDTTASASPEPAAPETLSSSPESDQPEPVPADEPVVITPVEQPDPSPEQAGPTSDAPPAEASSGPPPAAPDGQTFLVRLEDVLAHVRNWFARHPEVAREAETELSSAITTSERLDAGGGAAPVGDRPPTSPEPAPSAE